jgi:hypothetical protein
LFCRTHDCLFEVGLLRILPGLEVQIIESRPTVLGNALAQVVTAQTRKSVRRSLHGYEPGPEFLEWSLEHRVYRRV